jgi:hypothetical protein
MSLPGSVGSPTLSSTGLWHCRESWKASHSSFSLACCPCPSFFHAWLLLLQVCSSTTDPTKPSSFLPVSIEAERCSLLDVTFLSHQPCLLAPWHRRCLLSGRQLLSLLKPPLTGRKLREGQCMHRVTAHHSTGWTNSLLHDEAT